jgi:hypothetical protein
MTQKELNSSLFKYAKLRDLINIKLLLEQGANIHFDNDYALKWSAERGYLEIVKYLVIDCNMVIKEETLEYLEENNLSEIINIVKSKPL